MEGCTAGIPDDILSDDQKKKGYIKETPQDAGKPSPVPYSLIVQYPSPDLPQEGIEKIYFTGAFKDVATLRSALHNILPEYVVGTFIRDSFEKFGAYRLEIIIAEWSIKIYKHPNNP
jgi:hypothetical protein